jgi:hypothetical protein
MALKKLSARARPPPGSRPIHDPYGRLIRSSVIASHRLPTGPARHSRIFLACRGTHAQGYQLPLCQAAARRATALQGSPHPRFHVSAAGAG